MNNLVAKRPASVMRTATQPVRDHTSAMQRLQDQYFAALSRAQAQYFEGQAHYRCTHHGRRPSKPQV